MTKPTIETIVFDFDGTLTEPWNNSSIFSRGYYDGLRKLIGSNEQEFNKLYDICSIGTFLNPEVAWNYKDKLVSSAIGDPFLRTGYIAGKILDALGLYTDKEQRTKVLGKLYAENYAKTPVSFKPDVKEVMYALSIKYKVYVVSNSSTERVEKELDNLYQNREKREHIVRVLGDAKKYEIDDNWDKVPEALYFQGIENIDKLRHPVLLRRKNYFEVLDKIRSEKDSSFERMLVIGDNYDLDLALPQALGTAIGFVEHFAKLGYEKKLTLRYERGFNIKKIKQLFCLRRI